MLVHHFLERSADRLSEQTALTAIWQERARVLSDQLALAAPQSPVEAPGATEAPAPAAEDTTKKKSKAKKSKS